MDFYTNNFGDKIISDDQLKEGISHIYTNKHWSNSTIQLLCTGVETKAEHFKVKKHMSNCGIYCWVIDSVRQYSIGAGHNANCTNCLKIYAEKTNRNLGTVINKLVNRINELEQNTLCKGFKWE